MGDVRLGCSLRQTPEATRIAPGGQAAKGKFTITVSHRRLTTRRDSGCLRWLAKGTPRPVVTHHEPDRSRATQRISLFSEPGPPEALLTVAYNPIRAPRREPAQRQTQPDVRVEDDRREDDRNPDARRAARTRARCEAERSIGKPRRAHRARHELPHRTQYPCPIAQLITSPAREGLTRRLQGGTLFLNVLADGRMWPVALSLWVRCRVDDAQLEHDGEALLGVLQVDAAHFDHPAQAVPERVRVHVHHSRRGGHVSEGVEPRA